MTDKDASGQYKTDLSFKIFYELMDKKVNKILLISSPYDAFIMEEDGRLAERIRNEYAGLNLSRPPRVTWVSTPDEAFRAMETNAFDFAITMPQVDQMDAFALGREIRRRQPDMPVYLLTHNTNMVMINQLNQALSRHSGIDRVFVWLGNTDLLLALIKNFEDRNNVLNDTRNARVRVIILVEDSPYYYSTLLPLLYKELVGQTRALISLSINEEHRLLRMRARPKILHAENLEQAKELYETYQSNLLCVLSDVRFPRDGAVDPEAGFRLLECVKSKTPDLPLVMLSSEEHNRVRAEKAGAFFINKNSATLHAEIHEHFITHLGFGDFIFRMPDGREIGRAASLRDMEKVLPTICDASIAFHAAKHDFSTWLLARSEIRLAYAMRQRKADDFKNAGAIRAYLIDAIRTRRRRRQKGIISDFTESSFDPDFDFMKMGGGSLGGKARGLAFMTMRLKQARDFQEKYADIEIRVPKTVVLCTDAFDDFLHTNQLKHMIDTDLGDAEILALFFSCKLPWTVRRDLKIFLDKSHAPLAVRSSSLLEDAQFQPCAGLYNTYMLPNNHEDINVRRHHLYQAVKLVYASTFLAAARAFAKSSVYQTEDEKMAVIIQEVTGERYGRYFYPDFSGVVQSHNYYPIGRMKPEDGIAHIALGLGKTVVEGFSSLRFSPPYPQYLPQFSSVKDIMQTSQRYFYALDMEGFPDQLTGPADIGLEHLDIEDHLEDSPVRMLSSTYYQRDDRIRDMFDPKGYPVLTFARILKYKEFPLGPLLRDILQVGREGMGSPVEIEFAVNLCKDETCPVQFSLLQIRPMAISTQRKNVSIDETEKEGARVWSNQAMGAAGEEVISDIVYVRPDSFDPAQTVKIGQEVSRINHTLAEAERKYLLIGPGRWGSSDRWLGVPVVWNDISAVCAIVETDLEKLSADPSQGSHFFHNITSLGVGYLTVTPRTRGLIDWEWIEGLEIVSETEFVRHVQVNPGLTLKIDGKKLLAVLK